MLNVLYTELLKLKRSKIVILLMSAAIAFPIIMFFGWLFQQHEMEWEKYLFNIELATMGFFGVILFSVVSADFFSKEYNDKTISVLYAYCNGRIIFMCSKFIIIFLLIACAYLLQFSFAIITGLGLTLFVKSTSHEILTLELVSTHFIVYVKSGVMQFMLVPLASFIGMLGKNTIASTVYGGIVGLGSVMITSINPEISQYYPWAAPAMHLFSKTRIGDTINLTYVGITVMIAFTIGCILCLAYSLKEDIN